MRADLVAAPVAPPRRRASTPARREALTGYLYILPWLIGLAVFTVGPIVASAALSFTRYEILTPPELVGLGNYRHALFEDDVFWKAVYNTFFYAVIFVPLSVVGALGTALLLNERIVARPVVRALFFIPSITPVVASTLLWVWILNPEFGPLNGVLAMVGIEGPRWLASPQWAKSAIVLMSLWGAIGGGTMIIFLAGLQGIPRELYEAANIDGASGWQKLWSVTLPMLSPSMFFNLVVGLIAAFRVFTPAYIATDGGPSYATTFYVLYLFMNAFRWLNMGYASALAWLFVVLVAALVVIQIRLAARWVFYEGAEQR